MIIPDKSLESVPTSRLRSIWTIIWKILVFVCLWGLLLTPFIIPFKDNIAKFGKAYPLQTQLYFDATSALAVLVAAWIMVKFIDRRPFVTLGFAPKRFLRDTLAGSGIGTVWLGVSVLGLFLFGWASTRPVSAISLSALLWAAAALVCNTVAQEVLVRSYLYQTIESQTNFIWAIAGSSIIFMLMHAGALHGAWLPALNLFLAGVFFAVAYHRTGNLWLPIAIHFVWNFLLGPVLGLTVSGQNELNNGWQMIVLQGPALWTGGFFGLEGGLAVTLTATVGAAAVFYFIHWRNPEDSNGHKIQV